MIYLEVTKNKGKFFYIPIRIVWKITKNSHFWLKIHKPQYVAESPEILTKNYYHWCESKEQNVWTLRNMLVKNAENAFFMLQSIYKMTYFSAVGCFQLLLSTVVKISRKKKVIFQNAPHRTPKWLLNNNNNNNNNRRKEQQQQQMPKIWLLSKIWEYWTDMCICVL